MSDPNITSTTSNRYTVSKTFGEGYGDLALLSSDGIVFHFSSFLLAYSSPVFKDMLEIASKADNVIHQSQNLKGQPVPLSEDAVTLDLLLRHIDPVATISPPQKPTIVKLLDAARKYQLPAVFKWFEAEATRGKIRRHGSSDDKPLIEEDPMLILSLALDYEINDLAREALLSAVNGGPLEELESWGDVKYYRLVHRLRERRIKIFLGLVREISYTEEYEDDESAMLGASTIQNTVCKCLLYRSTWLLDITARIHHTPTWDNFVAAIEMHDHCSKEWSRVAKNILGWNDSTRDKIRDEEKKLPNLP